MLKQAQVLLLIGGLLTLFFFVVGASAQRGDTQRLAQQVDAIDQQIDTLDKTQQDFRLQIEKRLTAIETEFATIKMLLWAVVIAVGSHLGTSLLNLVLRKPREG